MSDCGHVDIGEVLLPGNEASHGRPRIAQTGLTVHDVAALFQSGLGAEEIVANYRSIPRAGVYAAIAYYLAHRLELESDLADDEAEGALFEAEYKRKQLANSSR